MSAFQLKLDRRIAKIETDFEEQAAKISTLHEQVSQIFSEVETISTSKTEKITACLSETESKVEGLAKRLAEVESDKINNRTDLITVRRELLEVKASIVRLEKLISESNANAAATATAAAAAAAATAASNNSTIATQATASYIEIEDHKKPSLNIAKSKEVIIIESNASSLKAVPKLTLSKPLLSTSKSPAANSNGAEKKTGEDSQKNVMTISGSSISSNDSIISEDES